MEKVEDHLKALIVLYQEEKVRLQGLIEEFVVENDYLMAHYHSNAVRMLNFQLGILNKFQDPNYMLKYFKLLGIDRVKKLLQRSNSDRWKQHYEEELQYIQRELNEINERPKKKIIPKAETLIHQAILQLIAKKIKNLKLILQSDDNLLLNFGYYNKTLKVTMPFLKKHLKKRTLQERNIDSFKRLGFEFADNQTKLILRVTGSQEDILDRVEIVLSKIVFDILHDKQFEHKSYIQYTNKYNS